jgi:multiple antibiotic resistance protein
MIMGALGLAFASVLSLLPIANPLSTAALFMSLTQNASPASRKLLAKRVAIYAFGILAVFFIAGGAIMSFFGISIPGLRIAGGIMIVRVAFGMMANDPDATPDAPSSEMLKQSKSTGADLAFTPLAMPSLSGPGAIAATISLTSFVKNWLDWLSILVGILSLCVISYYTLASSSRILKWIGPNGLEVFRKIMGFLILCIGVQFIVNGVVGFLSDPQIMRPIMEALSGSAV